MLPSAVGGRIRVEQAPGKPGTRECAAELPACLKFRAADGRDLTASLPKTLLRRMLMPSLMAGRGRAIEPVVINPLAPVTLRN
jgi:hypothetical protein